MTIAWFGRRERGKRFPFVDDQRSWLERYAYAATARARTQLLIDCDPPLVAPVDSGGGVNTSMRNGTTKKFKKNDEQEKVKKVRK